MAGGIVGGWYTPHPPIIIPAVGKGEEVQAAATREAMVQAATQMAELGPDAVVVIGPHGPIFADSFTLEVDTKVRGSFAAFGAPEEKLTAAIDIELTTAILHSGEALDLPLAGLTARLKQRFRLTAQLDHGALIPLWFLAAALGGELPPVVLVNVAGLPLLEHYSLGTAIRQAAEEQNKRVVVIGSGDLSHRLSVDAPAGYHPKAYLFDEGVAKLFREQGTVELFALESLAEDAGECGLRPLAAFLGAFEGLAGEYRLLSYEAPWGVGYLVATRSVIPGEGPTFLAGFLKERQEYLQRLRANESPPVRLARETIEGYVRQGKLPEQPSPLPDYLPKRAGAFVTLYKHGELRGCIGTTEATRPELLWEIVHNAVSAAGQDPRFDPVRPDELADLVYSVDVLGEAEPIEGLEELDPKNYGVIVKRGNLVGLLLPDLPGIDTAEEQVAIAKRKAGIGSGQEISLMRFKVSRYV